MFLGYVKVGDGLVIWGEGGWEWDGFDCGFKSWMCVRENFFLVLEGVFFLILVFFFWVCGVGLVCLVVVVVVVVVLGLSGGGFLVV